MTGCNKYYKPGCHISSKVGDSLSVIIQGENSQRILLMNNHRQWNSPISTTYENQTLSNITIHLYFIP